MKFGIHFNHWGSFYESQGVIKCLQQAKSVGAEVFEFFPTDAMFQKNQKEIDLLKDVIRDLDIEPTFTFGYPKRVLHTSDQEESRNGAVEFLNVGLREFLTWGKISRRNRIWLLARRLWCTNY